MADDRTLLVAEWSGLHGLPRLRPPVLKVITNTDATAQRGFCAGTDRHFPRRALTVVLPLSCATSVTLTKFTQLPSGTGTRGVTVSIRPCQQRHLKTGGAGFPGANRTSGAISAEILQFNM